MKRTLIILSLIGLTGCVRFEAHPLAPEKTAAQLEARRLDAAGLRTFMEQNLGRKLVTWPLPEWDLTNLTIAAFYYHPSLEVARAQWALARAGIKTAGGRPNPSVTVTPGYDTTATSISPWLPMLSFDWPIETAGKRNIRIAGARERAGSARWDILTAAWQVRSNVRDTLLDWRVAELRGEVLAREAAVQEQIVEHLQQRVAAGAAARSKLVPLQIALHKTRLDQQDAQARSSDAHVRLAGTLGLGIDALTGIKLVCEFSTNDLPELTAPAARHLALTSRSELMGALADYAAAEADLQLEVAKQYPDVHLGPGYQYNQGDNQWLLGLTVELPVLNQNQGPIAEAEAQRRLAAAKVLALQAQILAELDRAVAAYRQAQKTSGSGDYLLAAEQVQEASVRIQQQAGVADQSDLLAAQLETAGASLVQLDDLTALQQARNAIEDALQRPADAVAAVINNLPTENPHNHSAK